MKVAINVDLDNCVSIFFSTTSGNKYKLTKCHMPNVKLKIFFSFRTVNVWNFLQNDIVGCKTAHGFIVKLKSLLLIRFLKGQDIRPDQCINCMPVHVLHYENK